VAKINQKNEITDADINAAEGVAFFPEAGRGKTLLHIVNLARFNPGIILLMGDEGSGRSFLLQKLALRVNKKPGLLAVINRVVKTKPDLYRAIAESFALDVVEGESVDALEERVLDYLPGCFVTHRPVILAVDNIQQFSLSMLEELIGLLRKYKKISLLLIGDNNLSAMLKHLDTGKAVRHEVTLQPQSRGEMRQFINWRLPFAIDDREFEDIVNTTKGNFALLEREAQKKELAHKGGQSSQENRVIQFARSKKWLLLSMFLLVAATSGALFYFTQTDNAADMTTTQSIQKPKPVPPEVVESTKNEMVDRQLELLAAPEKITPEIKTVETAIVQKPPVAEQKPVDVPKFVEKPKPVMPAEPVPEPRPVLVEQKFVAASEDDAEQLLAMSAHHYSIQLLGGQSKKTIDRFMAEHRSLDKLFYFRSERDGKDWYIVMYGEYENRQTAIQAAGELPDELKKTSPWPRRLSEIHLLINSRTAR
jgi:DamX protein